MSTHEGSPVDLSCLSHGETLPTKPLCFSLELIALKLPGRQRLGGLDVWLFEEQGFARQSPSL